MMSLVRLWRSTCYRYQSSIISARLCNVKFTRGYVNPEDTYQPLVNKRGDYSSFICDQSVKHNWGALKHLRLMSEVDRLKDNKKESSEDQRQERNNRPYNPEHILFTFLEEQGFDFDDVMQSVSSISLSTHSFADIRWRVYSLIAERKKLNVANLLRSLEEYDDYNFIVYDADPSHYRNEYRKLAAKEYLNFLVKMGATESSAAALKEEIDMRTDITFPRKLPDITRILMLHVGTSAQSIVDEYACLFHIDMPDLLDATQELKLLGYKLPSEVLNYIYMVYIPPHKRKLTSMVQFTFYKLLGISFKEGLRVGLSRHRLVHILSSQNGYEIQDMYNMLLRLHFTAADIAKAPCILAFKSTQLANLLTPEAGGHSQKFQPKYAQAVDNVTKLNLIITYLDCWQDFLLTDAQNYHFHPLSPLNDVFNYKASLRR